MSAAAGRPRPGAPGAGKVGAPGSGTAGAPRSGTTGAPGSGTAGALTIAEVAAATGTSAHTLRYYERIGLIRPVSRARSGHRRYGPDDVRWVEFLRKLQATGMPIRRMLAYAALVRRGEGTISERRALLEAHRDDVAAKLAEQQAHLAIIEKKVLMYLELEKQSARRRAS
ncbi:MerR family transcriptional regulator [Sorangium sp. So ce1078]|uniref:MerR family transcriptional regulator n=1 Tax=Sorangium sp. So ce1078 TaxID=3133329 RepID=UPI003F62FD38